MIVASPTATITLPDIEQGTVLFLIALASAIIAVMAWVKKKVSWAMKKIEPLSQMIEDWNGLPDRPGVPGRPGVMESIEDIREIAQQALYHSKPNGGNSAYDHLSKKLDDKVNEIREDVAGVQSDTSVLITTLADHTNALADNSNAITDLKDRMSASEKDRRGIHKALTLIKVGGTDNHYEAEESQSS